MICRAGNGDRGAASGGVDAVRLTWWLNGLTTSICKEQQKHWLEINQWDDNLSLLCNQLCQIVQIMFITGQDLWLQQCFLKSVRKINCSWYICKGCYQDFHHYLIILVYLCLFLTNIWFQYYEIDLFFNLSRWSSRLALTDGDASWRMHLHRSNWAMRLEGWGWTVWTHVRLDDV